MAQDRPSVDVRVISGEELTREQLELRTLLMRREELKGQISSSNGRRSEMVSQWEDATGQMRTSLGERIMAHDTRTARIESDLNTIDDRISALMGRGVTLPRESPMLLAPPPPPGIPEVPVPWQGDPFESEWGELFGGMVALQGLTFAMLGILIWRSFRRQVSHRLSGEDANRLDQLQRSVDVMAVEVERISESQRFTAKLLNERAADPARLAKDAERVR
jgi:hypothetical protein